MCKCSMIKTIKVEEKVWKKLMKWRVDLGCKNIAELLEKIVKIVQASDLKKEVKK